MQTGWKTSEFWLAAKWSLATAGLLAWLVHNPPACWIGSLAIGLPLAVMAYMAGVVVNNYGENRFQLKARDGMRPQEDERGPMGFGRYVQEEREGGEGG